MNKILKYKLENIDQQTVEIRLPARILSAIEQNNDIVLYSIVDEDKAVPTIPVDILIKGTGEIIEDNIGIYTFLGTVELFDSKEIWHVFYRYTGHDNIVSQSDRLGEPIIEDDKIHLGKGGILAS